MFSQVFGRYGECLPIPAYTCLRIFVADCLITVAVTGFSCERQVHHPVVREIHCGPSGGIKLRRVWPLVVNGGSFGQIVEIFRTATKILFRERGVSEGKLPVPVYVDSVSLVLCQCMKGCNRTNEKH